MYSDSSDAALPASGFPIRKSPDQSVLAAPRSLSQLTTSFIAIRCQGIHCAPLVTRPTISWSRLFLSTSSLYFSLPYAIVKEQCFLLCKKHEIILDSLQRVARIQAVAHTPPLRKISAGHAPLHAPLPAKHGGRAWNRTRDLVLIRDAL